MMMWENVENGKNIRLELNVSTPEYKVGLQSLHCDVLRSSTGLK
jgi:hypothetical protein